MAVSIHTVRVGFFSTTKTLNGSAGTVIDKNGTTTTINDVLNSVHEHRIIPDTSVTNSANYPRVDDYLKLEAAAGYIVKHMDQNMIVTYQTTS